MIGKVQRGDIKYKAPGVRNYLENALKLTASSPEENYNRALSKKYINKILGRDLEEVPWVIKYLTC
jgi:hypothetical protein